MVLNDVVRTIVYAAMILLYMLIIYMSSVFARGRWYETDKLH